MTLTKGRIFYKFNKIDELHAYKKGKFGAIHSYLSVRHFKFNKYFSRINLAKDNK